MVSKISLRITPCLPWEESERDSSATIFESLIKPARTVEPPTSTPIKFSLCTGKCFIFTEILRNSYKAGADKANKNEATGSCYLPDCFANGYCLVESRIDLHAAARLTVAMKLPTLLTLLIAGTLAAGCASKRPAHAQSSTVPPRAALQTIVTPDNSLSAKVASYNATGRFVILSFPVGQMPRTDQTLFLYRANLKVGEVKITGPQRDNNIAADIVTGEAQVGDEVRDQ